MQTLPLPLLRAGAPGLAAGGEMARWADALESPQHHPPDRGRAIPGAHADGGHRHGGGGGLRMDAETRKTWEFINTFANWPSAIGTLAAVGVALYLAFRERRISLKLSAGHVLRPST